MKEKQMCDYGCGKEARHQLKNGKWCCSKSVNSCLVIKKVQIAGLKKAYNDGRKDCSHFDGKRNWSKGKKLKTEDEVFCINNLSSEYVKNYIITKGIVHYSCNKCKIEEWQGEKIVLELDHTNGNSNDNRLENLRLLCPNCHSQTPTFRGRNINKGVRKVTDKEFLEALESTDNIRQALIKIDLAPKGGNYNRARKIMSRFNNCLDCGESINKNAKRCKKCSSIHNNFKHRRVERPSQEQLLQEIEELGYCGTGRKYGVSDNAIRKWLK